MRPDLPSGSVTFLFTDVEGSTRLLHELGAEGYAEELAEHRRLIREACVSEAGVEVDTQGDAFFFAFPTANGALAAAEAFTATLTTTGIRVRVGIHTGAPLVADEGYVGDDVHFAARVAATSHGGQVVCSKATAELVDAELIDLGSHRLKDIGEPVSIYQLGDGSFPPLKTIANSNLPTPVSSFLGREDELYGADVFLQQTRLLTISGPGGQGKTRFALELARRAREERFADYRDGVFSCFLSSLRDPGLVLATIAQTLSVKEQPGQSALAALSAHLGGKRLLLLLDNLEHLLDAAAELSELLQAIEGITLLVTSRELLRIQGEHAYALPPLAQSEGVALFCERAQTEPTPEIGELCARLEGLPLAIELAAARMTILTPSQLLDRLSQRLDLLKGGRDADPRQQTLRATIEWSYDLLSPEEQQLFVRLSVFQGGCTLEATEQVCGANLDILHSLVDKSLLRFSEERFWMLETIREYAAESLEQTLDVNERRQVHAEHFGALAVAIDAELRGTQDEAWLDRLAVEHDNIRAALAWGVDLDPAGVGARLVTALQRFWWIRAHGAEGRLWLDRLLRAREHLSQHQLSQALSDAAWLASESEEWEAAVTHGSEALRLAREVDDMELVRLALQAVAFPYDELGLHAEAASALDDALECARVAGDRFAEAACSYNLGQWAMDHGDLERAHASFERALRLSIELDAREGIASSRLGLGYVLRRREMLAASADFLRLGLVETARLGFPVRVAVALLELSAVRFGMGASAPAAKLLGAAESISDNTGLPSDPRLAAELRKQLTESLGDDLLLLETEGRSMSLDQAVEYALASID